MLRGRATAWLIILATVPGCYSSYQYKEGDLYILILIAALVAIMVLFGTIARGKNEILDADRLKAKKFREELHELEDNVRLKRDALYRAQQRLLGEYDRILTKAQRQSPRILKIKRKLIDLEREILAAEGKRNSLRKEESLL